MKDPADFKTQDMFAPPEPALLAAAAVFLVMPRGACVRCGRPRATLYRGVCLGCVQPRE